MYIYHSVVQPHCVSLYNMFYSVDPLASRLEPLLESLFSFIQPISIPSYQRYPTGE